MTPTELRLRAACLERRGYISDKAELCDNENAALLRDFAALLDRMPRIMEMLRYARPSSDLPASGAAQWMVDRDDELNNAT